MSDTVQDAPTIDATLSRNGKTLSFMCPHCRHTHQHKALDAKVGDVTHRPMGCTVKGSPYRATGAMLRIVG